MRSTKSSIGARMICAALTIALLLMNAASAEAGYTEEMITEYADPNVTEVSGVAAPADIRLGCVVTTAAEINPLYCVERDLLSVNRLVFESLVELDAESRPTPLLADRWEAEDKLWKFHLRENIVFHNGMMLTANDVAQSYAAILNSGVDTPYSRRLRALVESIEEIDNFTVGVHAKYAGYITLYAMTFPIIQAATMNDPMPRGTGAYWFTDYVQGVGVRLEMNPIWWKNDAKIRSIAAIDYYDTGDALEALQTGAISMLCTQSNRASLSRKLSNLTAMDYSTNEYEILVPNLRSTSVMSDLRLRQAVMYAIDRAAIAENGYGGMGIQCEVPVNPGSWLYESQSAIFYYSPERAYQLIQSCGWMDLTNDGKFNKVDGVRLVDLDVTIVTYNESAGSVRENAANLIAGYLEDVGMTAHVVALDKTAALKRVNRGDYDLALVGLELSDVPMLGSLLERNGSLNMNGFDDETLQTLSDQIYTSIEAEQFRSVLSQIQMRIVEELPFMGLLFRTGVILSTRSLAGLNGIHVCDTLNGMELLEP